MGGPRTPSSDPLRLEDPHWSLAFLYLAFRPTLFFQTFVLRNIPPLVALAAWLLGMFAVIDRFETKLLTGSNDALVQILRSSWGFYWGVVALLGVFAGVLYFAIGGWWYRVRLRWSGALDPDPALARRVYLFAAQVTAVPGLLISAWDSIRFKTPGEAFIADKWTDWLLLVLIFWTLYVSYRGVRTAFDVHKWKARLWFLILPAMLYGSLLAIGIVVALTGLLIQTPDLDSTVTIEREAFRLDYPGNWSVDTTDPDYDPDANFTIEPMFADAVINFWFYVEPLPSRECVDATLDNMSASYELDSIVVTDNWGAYSGAGYEGTARIEGTEFYLLMFCSTEQDTPFEVMILSEQEAHETIHPGFEHIEETFRLESGQPIVVPGTATEVEPDRV